MDTLRRTVHRAGRPIPLTAKEFALLQVLLTADGAVLSQEQLLERAWDENADPFTNTVRVTVNRLRRKLGAPELVETVVGAGYRITP
jgi:DNA-binding response OmpR family regulator